MAGNEDFSQLNVRIENWQMCFNVDQCVILLKSKKARV